MGRDSLTLLQKAVIVLSLVFLGTLFYGGYKEYQSIKRLLEYQKTK